MIIAKTVAQVRAQVQQWKKEGMSVGLVPTMGYLHEGHASLAKQAVALCNKTVVSVFVNPIQFGPSEDLVSYPRDFEHDCDMLEKIGVDLVFHPSPEEMYAPDFCTYVDMENLTTQLCGKSRPGHFKGVCTVVSKLFHIVQPNKAFFGEKDAQQLAIIRRMVRDLSFDIEIVGCPIVREADGLAKSSRNVYLNAEERKAALILSKTVLLGKEIIAKGERSGKTLTDALKANIQTEPLARIDYVDVVNGINMEPIENLQGQILVAMAVFIGKTRLIDNFSVTL